MDHEKYAYEEHWKRKKRFGRQQALIGAGILLAVIVLWNTLPNIIPSSNVIPTPTTSYIEYGSRRIPSVIPQQVDFPAPALTLQTPEGDSISLADHRDKIILLNLWATWCPGCEAEMPELEVFYQAHRDQSLLIIAANAEDSAEQVIAYREEMGLSFPLWLDAEKEIYRAFNNNHLPSSYIIDRTGTVRLAWYGPISLEMLETHVGPLLEE